jgi:Ran GTPase-activating protein (RanGAP) involved in mRNA processing and transport
MGENRLVVRDLSSVQALTIQALQSVHFLDCHDSGFGYAGAVDLAPILLLNKTLTHVDVSRCQLLDAGCLEVCASISGRLANRSIQYLDLAENGITDEGAKEMANALKKNSTLTNLILARNYIEDAGAEALGEALESNQSLTALDLQANLIGDRCFSSILP